MTDKERIEVLEKVKKLIANKTESCICPAIERIIGIRGETYRNVRKVFPELKKYKPKGVPLEHSWWGMAIKKRLDVCDSMITEIKAKQ